MHSDQYGYRIIIREVLKRAPSIVLCCVSLGIIIFLFSWDALVAWAGCSGHSFPAASAIQPRKKAANKIRYLGSQRCRATAPARE